jgi:serine kinase of HPr protein (carbohydrate metabolism regulator)
MPKNVKDCKMSDSSLLHASLVEISGVGVLITGKSGSGKSDLALRLIENKQAKLVADDVVCVEKTNNQLWGKAPQNIAGMLEVRGVGIVEYPYLERANIQLSVRLVEQIEEIERMPKVNNDLILGLEIKQIALYAKENSAPDKIMAALRLMFGKTTERQ